MSDIFSTMSVPTKSIEKTYQRTSSVDHIIERPDSYIGSVEKETKNMWVATPGPEYKLEHKQISFVPGLYRIFDEILVNAADHKILDPNGMTCISIGIVREQNKIKVWNDGMGIPVVKHQLEKMFVPTLIFGTLLTSSNFDDTQKKVTGGRNGFGAKLCNIFSTKFTVQTASSSSKRAFKQSWENNMKKASDVEINENESEDYTCITFHPDLAKFDNMEKLDDDIVALFTRRAYDVAVTAKVNVYVNGYILPVHNFKDYCELYIKSATDDSNSPQLVYEMVNNRWEVAFARSQHGFRQISFVNRVATTRGGTHVQYIVDQITQEVIKQLDKKKSTKVKPSQVKLVKNHMWVFVNCLIENPSFDSQAKDFMTRSPKLFGSKAELSQKFLSDCCKSGIIESMQNWMKYKEREKLTKASNSKKVVNLQVPKLDDANWAGSNKSLECTLILTEGDSAKSFAVVGLSVIGRDRYGVYPLRGKLLNVRTASHDQVMKNPEIKNIVQIVGLRYDENYSTTESLKTLRYRRIMIMADQDPDGSHIKGLIINFIHVFWPNLLMCGFIEQFITPVVKIKKDQGAEESVFSVPEFEALKKKDPLWQHRWSIKHYKGLGTSTSKEAKEYFRNFERHRIVFRYAGAEDDRNIELAFNKRLIKERREWLTNFMKSRKDKNSPPEHFLYDKDIREISFSEFINKEFIHFSIMDTQRSIPSLCDGLKPCQRKVLYTCFQRRKLLRPESIKVAQLASSVAEMTGYIHGEDSLKGSIINLAQNYVGSNNLNLLEPMGQFGTRLLGGKDAANPRYIFTKLSSLARLIFRESDEFNNTSESTFTEPEYYLPIIPMVLVNGTDGIGTGWKTKVPNYDVKEIITNIKRIINNEQPLPMKPSYKNFRGTIKQLEEHRFVVSGEIAVISETKVEITELPIARWTQVYKETVLEPMLSKKKRPALIKSFQEYHTDTTVCFRIEMTAEDLAKAEAEGLHKFFKLQTTLRTSLLVLFDSQNVLRCFDNTNQILKEFSVVRKAQYEQRKKHMEEALQKELFVLENKYKLLNDREVLLDLIDRKLSKSELATKLASKNYLPDPTKKWKAAPEGLGEKQLMQAYHYLMSLPLSAFSQDETNKLLAERDRINKQLSSLRAKTPAAMWLEELDQLLTKLNALEQKEQQKGANVDPPRASNGRRVEPVIQELREPIKNTESGEQRQLRVSPRPSARVNYRLGSDSSDSDYSDSNL